MGNLNNCYSTKKCEFKVDADCVIYNFTDPQAPNYLTNLGLPNGTSVKQFMEKVDQQYSNLIIQNMQFQKTAADDLTSFKSLQAVSITSIKQDIDAQQSALIEEINTELTSVKTNMASLTSYVGAATDLSFSNTQGLITAVKTDSSIELSVDTDKFFNLFLDKLQTDKMLRAKLSQIMSASINENYVYSPTTINVIPNLTSASVSWNEIDNVDGYYVYYAQPGQSYTKIGPASINGMTIPGLTPDTVYEVAIQAFNNNEVSALSVAVEFKTK